MALKVLEKSLNPTLPDMYEPCIILCNTKIKKKPYVTLKLLNNIIIKPMSKS